MPIVYDSEYVKQTVALAVGQIDATLEGVNQTLGSDAVGMKRPSGADLAGYFFHQQQMYPPVPLAFPGTGMSCPMCHGTLSIPGPATDPNDPTADQSVPCEVCNHTGQISHVSVASPWIIALGECENGSEWLARFNSFVARNGGA